MKRAIKRFPVPRLSVTMSVELIRLNEREREMFDETPNHRLFVTLTAARVSYACFMLVNQVSDILLTRLLCDRELCLEAIADYNLVGKLQNFNMKVFILLETFVRGPVTRASFLCANVYRLFDVFNKIK